MPSADQALAKLTGGTSTKSTVDRMQDRPGGAQQALQDQLAPALKDTFPFEGERCQRL